MAFLCYLVPEITFLLIRELCKTVFEIFLAQLGPELERGVLCNPPFIAESSRFFYTGIGLRKRVANDKGGGDVTERNHQP